MVVYTPPNFYASRSSVLSTTPVRPHKRSLSHRSGTYKPGMHLEDIHSSAIVSSVSAGLISEEESELFNDGDFDFENTNDTGFESTSSMTLTPPGTIATTSAIIDVANYTQPPASRSHETNQPRAPSCQRDITSMLQQQQAVLQQLLDGQRDVEKCQSQLEERLACLQSKVEQPPTPTSSASSDGRRKRIVTHTLSVSLLLSYFLYCGVYVHVE